MRVKTTKAAAVSKSGRVRRRATPAGSAGLLPGARKDAESVTPTWLPVGEVIDGVNIQEVKNVPRGRGYLTEIFRRDWRLDDGTVDQVFQVWLAAGEVSAWHMHAITRDRLFVLHGLMKVVLYDGRKGSSTFGRLNELRVGTPRPALITIPPGVWHGVQNLSGEPGALLNLVDRAYRYEDPDHWRLPTTTSTIPYRFDVRGGSRVTRGSRRGGRRAARSRGASAGR